MAESFNLFEYALLVASDVKYVTPDTLHDALTSKESDKWKLAMCEEIESMHNTGTCKLVSKPENAKVIGSKWIFRIKEGGT